MTEENEQNANNERKWQFWFLVTFSLLLVVTFVFYLPTRFERNFLREEAGHMLPEEMDMMHEDEHGGAVFHEEGEVTQGLAVNLNVIPVPVLAGSSTQLDFFVNEKPNTIPVPFSQIEIDHTKLMHVIGVRSDLNEFFHIHPEPLESGIFTIPYVFSSPGTYKLWSEVKKDGVIHSFGHPLFDVQGEGERESKQVSFERNVVVGGYQVSLELAEPVGKGHEHDLSFDVHTLQGSEVTLENYLGVPMHLAVIKDDLTQFIHTHPEEGDHHGFQLIQEAWANGDHAHPDVVEDEAVNFHVTFPEAGLYKVFAQFRPEGISLPEDKSLVASFWIKVEESSLPSQAQDHHESTQLKPLQSPAWWFLLAVSLALILLLSLAIHKFITVKK